MLEDDEREYLKNWENEKKYEKEFLRAIQELIDEKDAQTKSQNQSESQQQPTVNTNSEFQGKSRKELFEEYEKKYLNKLSIASKERNERIKKADEIVAKRLSESYIES